MLERYLETTGTANTASQRFPLDPLPAVIGRQPGTRVQIYRPAVSRLHAEIDLAPGGTLRIRDLGSTNGTFVNGRRIKGAEAVLHGDVIQIGDVELLLIERVTADTTPEAATRIGLPTGAAEAPIRIREFTELLDQGLVCGYYQTIFDRDGQPFGAELLGRTTHPGMSGSPAELFALAERIGEERRLSRLLRETSFAAAARAGLQGPLFFNVHPLEFDPPQPLLQQLGRLRAAYPDLELVFEVHEKAVTDLDRMAMIRAELTGLGIALAYDDFGAGQARLQELIEVPPDYLKFDVMLVRGLLGPESPKYRMLASLNQMIQTLGIRTLAEGIEDEACVQACREIGIELYQGFYFARPQPIPEPILDRP